jgi:hypothetical protein
MDATGKYNLIFVKAVTRVTPQGVFKGYIGTALDINDNEQIKVD